MNFPRRKTSSDWKGFPVSHPFDEYMVCIRQQHTEFEFQITHHNNIILEESDGQFMHHSQHNLPESAWQEWRCPFCNNVQDVNPSPFSANRQNREQDAGVCAGIIGKDVISSPAMCAQIYCINPHTTQEAIMKLSALHTRTKTNAHVIWGYTGKRRRFDQGAMVDCRK